METPSQQDRAEALHKLMLDRLDALTSSDAWAQALEQAARFHDYSLGNLLLIALQRPDARRVAGFQTWKSLGRHVRKGERGIAILAPMTYKRTATDEATGEEREVIGVRGFRPVYVFDIAQTDGAELFDTIQPERLTGDGPAGLYDAIAEEIRSRGFSIVPGEPTVAGANGETCWASRTVRFRSDLSPAQRAKTAAHELAHIALGHDHAVDCRSVKEVEAESVAYIIVRSAGMDSDTYSLPYVAGWSDGKAEVVRGTAEHVIATAREIMASLENTTKAAA
jgi:antirestriction protein ArdC